MRKRCVFLDRDGVVNVSPPEGEYILRWEEFHFIPEIEDWVKLFNAQGYLVIVVTNQRCVARGLISEAALRGIHSRMVEELAARGATIHGSLLCPHDEAVCDCRKPSPGMVRRAEHEWDIDLSQSIMVGDSDRDEQLAVRCGLPFVRVQCGHVLSFSRVQVEH